MAGKTKYAWFYWMLFTINAFLFVDTYIDQCYEPTMYEGNYKYATTMMPRVCNVVNYEGSYGHVTSNYTISVVNCLFDRGCTYQYGDIYVGVMPALSSYMTIPQTFTSDCGVYTCARGKSMLILDCAVTAFTFLFAVTMTFLERRRSSTDRQQTDSCKA